MGQKRTTILPMVFQRRIMCTSTDFRLYIYDQEPVQKPTFQPVSPESREKIKYTCNCFITECNPTKQGTSSKKISETSFSSCIYCSYHNNTMIYIHLIFCPLHHPFQIPSFLTSILRGMVFLLSEWLRANHGGLAPHFQVTFPWAPARSHSIFFLTINKEALGQKVSNAQAGMERCC